MIEMREKINIMKMLAVRAHDTRPLRNAERERGGERQTTTFARPLSNPIDQHMLSSPAQHTHTHTRNFWSPEHVVSGNQEEPSKDLLARRRMLRRLGILASAISMRDILQLWV